MYNVVYNVAHRACFRRICSRPAGLVCSRPAGAAGLVSLLACNAMLCYNSLASCSSISFINVSFQSQAGCSWLLSSCAAAAAAGSGPGRGGGVGGGVGSYCGEGCDCSWLLSSFAAAAAGSCPGRGGGGGVDRGVGTPANTEIQLSSENWKE